MNWRIFILGILFITSTQVTHAAVTPDDPGNFITTWNTENAGTSNDNQITIPGTGGGYSYELYWEDTSSSTINGTTTLITTDSYTHTFPAPGIYEVQASGTIPRIYFNNGGDRDKILTVEQWGNIAWTSMENAFYGASNLRVPATDAPDFSGVTSLSQMFREATVFNDPINHWDVSTVTTMYSMFNGFSSSNIAFNQPLDNWNTGNLMNMQSMFRYSNFNQNINNWNVANLTNLNFTFAGTSFNQPLNNWNISSVTNLQSTFNDNLSFNQPLNNWNTASVTSMHKVFGNTTQFDQDLSSWSIESLVDTGAWAKRGLKEMFLNSSLSPENINPFLISLASQAATYGKTDITFHLGLKSYSDTGEAALNTLATTYNWDITEQYQATYMPSEDASLIGDNIQQPLDSGATTTAVTLNPSNNCEFLQWSDGNTDNPRQDVLTDNLNVTAELRCQTYGTSASTQRDKAEEYGNTTQAEEIEDRFLTTTSTSQTYEAPETLDAALTEVERLPDTINTILETDRSPETISTLIAILLQLVEALTQLMLQGES